MTYAVQKLALAISPECEHRAIKDGARVKRFDVSIVFLHRLAAVYFYRALLRQSAVLPKIHYTRFLVTSP